MDLLKTLNQERQFLIKELPQQTVISIQVSSPKGAIQNNKWDRLANSNRNKYQVLEQKKLKQIKLSQAQLTFKPAINQKYKVQYQKPFHQRLSKRKQQPKLVQSKIQQVFSFKPQINQFPLSDYIPIHKRYQEQLKKKQMNINSKNNQNIPLRRVNSQFNSVQAGTRLYNQAKQREKSKHKLLVKAYNKIQAEGTEKKNKVVNKKSQKLIQNNPLFQNDMDIHRRNKVHDQLKQIKIQYIKESQKSTFSPIINKHKSKVQRRNRQNQLYQQYFQRQKKIQEERQKLYNEFNFKPQICQNYKKVQPKYKEQSKIFPINECSNQQNKCTFKPQINRDVKVQSYFSTGNIAQTLQQYKRKKRMHKQSSNISDMEEQMKQCTFKPQISRLLNIKQDKINDIGGIQDFLYKKDMCKKQQMIRRSTEQRVFFIQKGVKKY